MEYLSNTPNYNKYRILLGFIIIPFLTAGILTVLGKRVYVSTLLIPYLSTLIIFVPYFFYIHKINKVNLLSKIIGGLLTGIAYPSYKTMRNILTDSDNPSTQTLLIIYLLFSLMGLLSGALFWLISINKKWPAFNIKEIIVSFLLLAVIIVIFCEFGSINIRYSYVLTWGFIAVLSYSLITTGKIHPTNKLVRRKLGQAGYGLAVFTPLAALSILINIKESAAVTFTILAAILVTDGYQIFTKYKT